MTTSSSSGAVLIVEDEEALAESVQFALEVEGFEVAAVGDGRDALTSVAANPPDLVLLDLMLPGLSGLDVLRTIRRDHNMPVIILTAKDAEADKVLGLELGADDYVTKPFGLAELMARIRRLLRSSRARRHWQFGDVKVDTGARTVSKSDEPVELTTTEWDLLVTLLEARGEPVSRDDIFEKVWGEGHHGTRRTIDNFMGQLRNKLESDPSDPQHLLTVRGVGYRLDA